MYGNNEEFYKTVLKYLRALDKDLGGKILQGQAPPKLPQNYPYKDLVVSLGLAMKYIEEDQRPKVSDVTVCPYCLIYWNVGCDKCPYGHVFGKCAEGGSAYDKNFSTRHTSIVRNIQERKLYVSLRKILREGYKKGISKKIKKNT